MFTFTKEQKKLLGKYYANHMHPANDQIEFMRLSNMLDAMFDSSDSVTTRKLSKCVFRIERLDQYVRFPKPYPIKGLINYWGRNGDEHWREIFIFETEESAEGLAKYLEYEGYDLQETRNVPAGHAFQYPAHIGQLTATRFLVEMSGGLNV